MRKPSSPDYHGRRRLLHVFLLCVTAVLWVVTFAWYPGGLPITPRRNTTLHHRPLEKDVNCEAVRQTLVQLYHKAKQRRAHWEDRAYDLRTTSNSSRANPAEMHFVFIGDSWARRKSWATLRYLDLCRLRYSPVPPGPHECSLIATQHAHDDGASMVQLSLSALKLDAEVTPENGGLIQLHVHFKWAAYLPEAAHKLHTILHSGDPTPALTVDTFPRLAQCRRFDAEQIDGVEKQMPICLCKDTIQRTDIAPTRVVPVDVIQLIDGMWDTIYANIEYSGFDWNAANWTRRQQHFAPDLSVYPYITWEENVNRFRQKLADTYVMSVRETVAHVSLPSGVPMPRVLLSQIPLMDCKAPMLRELNNVLKTDACELHMLPLQQAVSEAVDAAFGKPAMGFPPVDPPEWLRLVDYRPLAYAVIPAQGNQSATIDRNHAVCGMSDGVHLNSDAKAWNVPESIHQCLNHATRQWWDSVR